MTSRLGVAAAGASGFLFAIGLGLSGMTKPTKVIGFLDLGGRWDASLAFVMAGAVTIYVVAYRVARKRSAPFFAERFVWPSRTDLDARLLGGAALFGVGWGLSGFCPGPALVASAKGGADALLFLGVMAVTMAIAGRIARPRAAQPSSPNT